MKFISLIILLLPSTAFAYPIFFKCSPDGRLSDQITPREMSGRLQSMVTRLRSLSETARENEITDLCDGGNVCMNELRQLMTMAQVGGQVTEEIIQAELSRVSEAARAAATNLQAITPMPAGIFESAAEYQRVVENVALSRECRVASTRMNPAQMELPDGACVLANFNHSPYMYPSGTRDNGVESRTGDLQQGRPNCQAIKDLVLGAISMDQDPYAAMAVSLMENGPEVESLYLDPIGAVGAIGCPSTRATANNHNLDSYQTYYNVQYGVVPNARLGNRIRDYLTLKGSPAEAGTSFACAGGNEQHAIEGTAPEGCSGSATASFCPRAVPGMCCSQLPIAVSPEQAEIAGTAITYSSLDGYISSPLAANLRGNDSADYPARRIQRFNGYSDSMGGAEAVSAWRSGVNYNNTPAYGYQALDFVLNTLWNNPFVRAAVEEAEAQLNRESKSVLCQDRQAGVYTMEHDHYFNKHANAPRMGTIQGRWNQNPSWSALATRHRNVMTGEIAAVCGQASRIASSEFCRMPGIVNGALQPAAENAALSRVVTEYFRTVHPQRRTVAMANQMDQHYTWNEMNEAQFGSFLNAYTNAQGRNTTPPPPPPP